MEPSLFLPLREREHSQELTAKSAGGVEYCKKLPAGMGRRIVEEKKEVTMAPNQLFLLLEFLPDGTALEISWEEETDGSDT